MDEPERQLARELEEEEALWADIPEVREPVFRIEERPDTWWECLLYGWQHTLVDISPFVLPLAVASALGMSPSESARFISFSLLAMGVATLIQTTVGNRLPIVQGPSATLTGTLVPVARDLGGPAMWGGILVGALVEVAVGGLRLLRTLRRLFPPAVSGVVVVSIGLALGRFAVELSVGDGGARDFLYAGGVIGMILLLQLVGRALAGGVVARGAIFLSIWIVGVGVAGVAGDVDWALVSEKAWFAAPTLFPYGGPGFGWTFGAAAILGILAGYLGSMVESIGDYAATCAVAGERLRVRHMNRGILAEGLGCTVAAVLGGMPCTSYTQNVGIIATTGVASRFVVQIAAVILALYGLCPKFGALLVAIPRPVLGGVFVVVCGMIAVSGIRLLQAAPATAANSLVIGTTLVVAVAVPVYATHVLGEGWLAARSPIVRLLATNSVVLAVLSAVLLNLLLNLLPGRGGSGGSPE